MFNELDNILEKMGIDILVDIETLDTIPDAGKELSLDELKKYLRYNENTGALKIEGMENTPILYIKSRIKSITDYFIPSRWSKHTFHILWCKTINEMFSKERGNRYVVVPAKNKVLEHIFEYMGQPQELEVCGNCLNVLKNNWNMSETKFSFQLKEMIGRYEPRYEKLPASEWLIPRKNGYPNGWTRISVNYRKSKNWICEKCKIDCSKDQHLLDTHHIDGNAHHTMDSNLKALCKICHSEEFRHEHYQPTEKQRIRIAELRRQRHK